jgi:hypothetical protein
MASAHELRTAIHSRMTEAIAKELNECPCAIVINTSTCLRMLSAVPPNVEGARETARRTISCSKRSAEAVSNLRALFSETSKRIETVTTCATVLVSETTTREFPPSMAPGHVRTELH